MNDPYNTLTTEPYEIVELTPAQKKEFDEQMMRLGVIDRPDLSTCPECGGLADNGHDRQDPPNPYLCVLCSTEPRKRPVTKPKRKTQVDDLIDYLRRWDHGITSYEAYSQLGITQLTARLSEAKKKGYQFRDEWVKHHARNGREVKLKRYWLVEDGL